jgi:spore maturation protein CgeB
MFNKVYLITPYTSQYSALNHFTQKFYEAWVRAGYEAIYFKKAEDALETALKDPPDLLIGFNGVPREEERYYCDILQCPYLSLLVDPFFRFAGLTASPYTILGCDDFSGLSGLQRMNFDRALFVPHAVEPELAPDPQMKRIYDVSFLATFIDYEARRSAWKSTYPDLICQAMDEMVEQTFADPQLPFVNAVIGKLQQVYQEYPALKSLIDDPWTIFYDIELYIKGKERVDLLRAIQTIPVHVFGNTIDPMDWKKFFEKQSNIIVHDAVPYEESLKILQKSKICLNSSIKNKFGAHERIFSGLAAGALVLTNENPYLKKFFAHDVDIAFFQFNHLNQMDSCIRSYLLDEDKRQLVVENGREIVMSYHTWDARIQMLESQLPPLIEKIQSY